MELDHERLDVYHLALDFLVMANGIIEALPRGRSHLADQFTRASTSIVLNLSEGAGKLSKPDKRRYYLTARGSATESAALLGWPSTLSLRLVQVFARFNSVFAEVYGRPPGEIRRARPSKSPLLSAGHDHDAGIKPEWSSLRKGLSWPPAEALSSR